MDFGLEPLVLRKLSGASWAKGQVGTLGVFSYQEKCQELPSLYWPLPLALPAHTWVLWARRIPQTLPRAATTFSLLNHATGSSFYTWLSMLQTATPDLLEPSYPSVCSQQRLAFVILRPRQHLFLSSQEEKNTSDSAF